MHSLLVRCALPPPPSPPSPVLLPGVLRTQWWFGMLQDFFVKYCGATWGVVLIIGPFFGARAGDGSSSSSSSSSSSGGGEAGWSLEDRAAMLSQMRYHTSVVISLFAAMGTLAASSRHFIRLRYALRCTGRTREVLASL